MLSIPLPPNQREPLKLLCLGARSDDIEIGCGGIISAAAGRSARSRPCGGLVFQQQRRAATAEARDSILAFLGALAAEACRR